MPVTVVVSFMKSLIAIYLFIYYYLFNFIYTRIKHQDLKLGEGGIFAKCSEIYNLVLILA